MTTPYEKDRLMALLKSIQRAHNCWCAYGGPNDSVLQGHSYACKEIQGLYVDPGKKPRDSCHSHMPGDGIDLLEADARAGTLLVRIDKDDCHYHFDALDLFSVLSENPWAETHGKGGQRSPALASDETAYAMCHKGKLHGHIFKDLYRFELGSHYEMGCIEVSVTACDCHIHLPVHLVFQLFGRAGMMDNETATARIEGYELQTWLADDRSGLYGFTIIETLAYSQENKELA